VEVRKAIITAAGLGTRFLPATKVQPKEMLPILNKPIIQYAVEEAVASGISQILIVTARGKTAVEDHFDRSIELEIALQEKGMLDSLPEILKIGEQADILYVRQREQLGLGHAVLAARSFVGEEPFALILPDDVIVSKQPALKQLIEVYKQIGTTILAVEEVPDERLSSYGVIKPRYVDERIHQVLGLIEKPEILRAPSRLGIVGRYILTPGIFSALEQTIPGKNGEIQLTDGLNQLLAIENIYSYRFEGIRYDCGTPLGLLKASIAFAMREPSMAQELKDFLAPILTKAGYPAGEVVEPNTYFQRNQHP
jgi:UTP--glucose-1-phosphate uridylyltransferase